VIDRTRTYQQYVVVRHDGRSYRQPEPVAGPFASWREAFLARCRLSATGPANALSRGDAFEVQPV
jgi:hypothetical protein